MTPHTFFCNKSFDLQVTFDQQFHTSVEIFSLKQVHSTNIVIIDEQSQVESIKQLEADSMLSNQKNICLAIKTADCLPILMFHPKGIIGAVHAGRRGTEAKIIAKVLVKAEEEFGVKGADFLFWFGPAICGKCYQIDKDQNIYFDLIKENLHQITSVTNQQPQVTISPICTLEDDTHHSYRRVGHAGDSNWSGICLS